MDDIPAEKMLGQFPEQACKKGCLKGGFEVDLRMRDDFEHQEEHAKGEEKTEAGISGSIESSVLSPRGSAPGNPAGR